jgi:hypothetical protein
MRIFIVEFEIIFWGDTDVAERRPAFTQFRATAGAAQTSELAAGPKGTAAEAHVPAPPSAGRNANSENHSAIAAAADTLGRLPLWKAHLYSARFRR